MRAVKRMGRGMVERYGERPGREYDQPSFTIRASAGGTEPHGFVWENSMSESVKVTIDEAAVLQGYPVHFTFAGNKGRQGLQVGNAVPPPLAKAILEALWA